jgi:hypothetical protein
MSEQQAGKGPFRRGVLVGFVLGFFVCLILCGVLAWHDRARRQRAVEEEVERALREMSALLRQTVELLEQKKDE